MALSWSCASGSGHGFASTAVDVGSFGGLIFPGLAFRLMPVLICLVIEAASLFVEFISPSGYLRYKIE